jgi:hypothetical protein
MQQGLPQPVVLAGNGTVNRGKNTNVCWHPLPDFDNEDIEAAKAASGNTWKLNE